MRTWNLRGLQQHAKETTRRRQSKGPKMPPRPPLPPCAKCGVQRGDNKSWHDIMLDHAYEPASHHNREMS